MKTLKQYERQLNEESVNLEDYINESIIDEGFLSALKDLIKGGLSLYGQMFKYSKEAGKDVHNFFKARAKNKADEKTLKNFVSGREFWDEWFKGSKWEKFWMEINPKAKESLEDNSDVINEEEMVDGNGTGTTSNNKQDKNDNETKDSKETEDTPLFSTEKFAKYKKYEGMIDIIIGGFTFVYDLAKQKNDRKALELVSGYIKNALKDPSVDDEQKKHLKEAIGEVKKAGEEQKEGDDEEKFSPKTVEQDKGIAQKVSKSLSANQNNVVNAFNALAGLADSLIDNSKNIIKEASEPKDWNEIIQLLSYKKDDENIAKIHETNRTAILQLLSAMSAIFENFKDDNGKNIDKNKLIEFIQYILFTDKTVMNNLTK